MGTSSSKVRENRLHDHCQKHTMPNPPRLKVLSAEQRQRITGMSLKDEAA